MVSNGGLYHPYQITLILIMTAKKNGSKLAVVMAASISLSLPEYELVVVFNGWNVFDIPRPTIEYLSERVLKAIYSR